MFGVQQEGGSPIDTVFQLGTFKEISVPASSQFEHIALTFTIDDPPFALNELTFSNSYDAPIGPISNSINPAGTILNIADVRLGSAVPEPATWVMMLIAFTGLGAATHSRRKSSASAADELESKITATS